MTSPIEQPGQLKIELATEWFVKRSEYLLIEHPGEWQYIMLVMFKKVRKVINFEINFRFTAYIT